MPKSQWTFKNQLGAEITTSDPVTAEKYRHDSRFTEKAAKADEPVPYAKRKKADLEADIAARNVGRSDDDALPATGTIAELAAALDADDANTGAVSDPA